ncbi:glycosyltransferase family 4 protein [Aestuariirhabdus sp. Z084]|uniref:glycosyltransferase family 4 protein n=1 Tax=Aestuariirhabdus haliotis TaxID=2918751 RepID=UPI00201B45C4|nr:glycosyltransferase family 4 protein [Aestuariirhabdus haliotis]MCL6416092.1 glycosyltransferase family 4 protein [Aestuariirhabdus haliotis]MCL6419340.1 glycosyltransferase family 4 protein [Aestuariirhabdus haliotis]
MNEKQIYSPMAAGNGAYVVHSILSQMIGGYNICSLPISKTVYPALLRGYRRPDHIVHTVPEYGDVFFLKNTKAVVTFHNYFWDTDYFSNCTLSQSLFYRFIQRGSVSKAVARADRIVAVSEYTADLVRVAFPGKEIVVIHNGVDTARFYPVLKLKSEKVVILFSGNPTKRKGWKILVDIARALPENCELWVTGGLRETGVSSVQMNIRLLGRIDYRDMPALYQQADMLLLPSYREGLSLSALEAMSCGLPVVSYNCSSMDELSFGQQMDLLSDPDDLAAILENILLLVEDEKLRKSIGEMNRSQCEAMFTLDSMVTKYKLLFESL